MIADPLVQTTLSQSEVQPLIYWLRSTTPDRVVEEVARHLRDGVPEDHLWAAGAYTAMRYINNQAHNLLGFVSHAFIGLEDARRLAVGQDEGTRHLLLVQSLHQVVFDMHDPCLSPFELVPYAPLHEKNVEENVRLLRMDVRMGEYMRADHRLVGLAEVLPRAELVDLLLDIALEGMITDDHTLITPVLSLGLMELVGWDDGFDMLRWSLRYSASFPRDFALYDRAVILATQYGLEGGAPVSGLQPERIDDLRAIFHAAAPDERPDVAARAMAEQGYSPETVLAAVSLAGCDLYLTVDPVPHEDFDAISREVAPIHIGTSSNALRSALAYMSPKTQVLAAIQGGSLLQRGPSVLDAEFRFIPFVPSRTYPYAEDMDGLSESEDMLKGLDGALRARDHRRATALVRLYLERNGDEAYLIAALTRVASSDDGTLMHNLKHLNSMIEEFQVCAQPDRWKYLAASARFISWYAEKNTGVYNRAMRALSLEEEVSQATI